MNILITSIGRQVFLVNSFEEALDNKGKLFISDFDENARALSFSDNGFVSPSFSSKEYIPWVLDICRSKGVDLLITLNVDDLLILEGSRTELNKHGVFLVGGDIQKIRSTYDKYELSLFCSKIGLKVPKTFLVGQTEDYSFDFPILAKPRFGKGSRGHLILNSQSELDNFTDYNSENNSSSEYVLQEYLDGHEFGLDIVNDFKSEYAGVLARKKLAMKRGETFEAITESPKEWVLLARKLSRELHHQGTIDIDVILCNGEKYIIDINHRFGGGYIFNHASGAHLPRAYVQWFQNMKSSDIVFDYLSYKPRVRIRRENLGFNVIS